MDIPGVAGTSTVLSNGNVGDAVQIAVLKKALDIEAQGAAQLVEAAREAGSVNPPHLGGQVDVYA